MVEIVETEDTLSGKPRIEGTRIGVIHVIRKLQEGRGFLDLMVNHDLDMDQIEAAILYYLRNPDKFGLNSGE